MTTPKKPKARREQFIDATIMALDHASGGDFSDYCEDSPFGNELLDWLYAERERITTPPTKGILPKRRGK